MTIWPSRSDLSFQPSRIKPFGGPSSKSQFTRLPFFSSSTSGYDRTFLDRFRREAAPDRGTYSILETERLLQFGEEATGKDRKEAVMILNHKEAIQYVVDNLASIAVSRTDICNIHALLADGLLIDPAMAGRLRRMPAGITHSSCRPLEDQYEIEEELSGIRLSQVFQLKHFSESTLSLFSFGIVTGSYKNRHLIRGDVRVHLTLQHGERNDTRAQQDIVEAANREALAERRSRPFAKLDELQLPDHVAARLPRPHDARAVLTAAVRRRTPPRADSA